MVPSSIAEPASARPDIDSPNATTAISAAVSRFQEDDHRGHGSGHHVQPDEVPAIGEDRRHQPEKHQRGERGRRVLRDVRP